MQDIFARSLGEVVQPSRPSTKPGDLTCCVCGVTRRPHVMFRYGQQRHRCPDCHEANRYPKGSSTLSQLDYYRSYYQTHKERYREQKRRQRERAKAAKATSSG